MSDNEKIDLKKLSQRDLIIRLLERHDTLASNISKIEMNVSKIDESVVDLRIGVAVLKAKSIFFGAVGGMVITIIANYFFNK